MNENLCDMFTATQSLFFAPKDINHFHKNLMSFKNRIKLIKLGFYDSIFECEIHHCDGRACNFSNSNVYFYRKANMSVHCFVKFHPHMSYGKSEYLSFLC